MKLSSGYICKRQYQIENTEMFMKKQKYIYECIFSKTEG